MFLSESLQKKWEPVLNHDGMGQIKDSYKRAVTAVVLENQQKALQEERSGYGKNPQSKDYQPGSVRMHIRCNS